MAPPTLDALRLLAFDADRKTCSEKRHRIVKTIRMNGALESIYNVSFASHRPKLLVLHLFRDPKAVFTSRMRLPNPFGVPHRNDLREAASRAQALRRWSAEICRAAQRDYAIGTNGKHKHKYELIAFQDLIDRPREVIGGIYARHLNRSMPDTVVQYINEHIRQGGENQGVAQTQAAWAQQTKAAWGTVSVQIG